MYNKESSNDSSFSYQYTAEDQRINYLLRIMTVFHKKRSFCKFSRLHNDILSKDSTNKTNSDLFFIININVVQCSAHTDGSGWEPAGWTGSFCVELACSVCVRGWLWFHSTWREKSKNMLKWFTTDRNNSSSSLSFCWEVSAHKAVSYFSNKQQHMWTSALCDSEQEEAGIKVLGRWNCSTLFFT